MRWLLECFFVDFLKKVILFGGGIFFIVVDIVLVFEFEFLKL